MKYGLIGEKLGHSFSKQIHEMIESYTYELKEIAREDFDDFMKAKDFKAINVTIPYKQMVIPYLDCIQESARKIHAVNTIVNRNGKLYGYNTDYDGLMMLLKRSGLSFKDKNVLILGTGGTSNTAYEVFRDLSAASITKVSRKPSASAVSYEEAKKLVKTNIIFNATPCGMYPHNDDIPLTLETFDQLEGVFDAIYNPLRTDLVLEAKKRGIYAEGGLYMLVGQAVRAIEYFLDKKIDDAVVDEVYDKILRSKENLALIGMPGSGKSTVARGLSDFNIAESDEKIIEKIGMSISEYFALYGEEAFREVESDVIRELSKMNGLLISTGGGAVVKEINMHHLKQNARIIYLKRDLEKLEVGNGRPLTSDVEALRKKYKERKELYERYADVIVENNGTIEETIERIKKL